MGKITDQNSAKGTDGRSHITFCSISPLQVDTGGRIKASYPDTTHGTRRIDLYIHRFVHLPISPPSNSTDLTRPVVAGSGGILNSPFPIKWVKSTPRRVRL